ncbi:MAG: hypothetical protein IGS48_17340 [Oscillatoriales cyanobacterium C42_A2020_001]|nr:hypothetical protein [Leptolyngbyaceae cyanobacterium C42_A2020_001]
MAAKLSGWVEQIVAAIAHYQNIHHLWQLPSEQLQVLQSCYDISQLLIACLNRNCEVTVTIQQETGATLLLLQKELEDWEWHGD